MTEQPSRRKTEYKPTDFVLVAENTRDVLKVYLGKKIQLGADKVAWNRDYATRAIARGQTENNQALVDVGNEINTLLDQLATLNS